MEQTFEREGELPQDGIERPQDAAETPPTAATGAASAEWQPTPAQRAYMPLKRLLDIVFSLLALVVLSPLFLVVAVIIKLDSPGPVFFHHRRIGKNGKTFELYKFRTMIEGADKQAGLLSPEEQEEFKREYKLQDDPRITRFGRSVRKMKLDEVPQFLNVLKGDISLIGPRPIIEEETKKYASQRSLLLSIKPGLTGYWQVNGKGGMTYAQRMQMELYYVKAFSLPMDIIIFFKTFGVIFQRNGV